MQNRQSVFLASPPLSFSVFSLTPERLFECLRILEYAKIQTVLRSKAA